MTDLYDKVESKSENMNGHERVAPEDFMKKRSARRSSKGQMYDQHEFQKGKSGKTMLHGHMSSSRDDNDGKYDDDGDYGGNGEIITMTIMIRIMIKTIR